MKIIFRNLSENRKLQLKRLASLIPFELRQGYAYWWWRGFIENAEQYPPEMIRDWQFRRLLDIVRYAYYNTDGYRELYRQASVHPDDIRSLDDLKHLPFTTKQLFQSDIESFTVKKPSNLYITTGGSTGIPFGFYVSRRNLSIERAFMHAVWNRVGWELGDISAVLRGGYIGSEQTPIQYDCYRRELNLSTYFLTEKTLSRYIKVIRRYRPKTIQAYPSALNLLVDLLLESNREDEISFDIILLGSENVYDWQLEKFQKTFPEARLFSWYGHAEMAILAPWCETERKFHVWPFYGYTEVIGNDNREVSVGEEGELVGTSFHNFSTPFIRYMTMDLAIKGNRACPSCGRPYLILDKIMGRSHEIIVSGNGRYISMTAINMHDDIFDKLKQFQFYQDEPGKLVFQYVPRSDLSDIGKTRIRVGLMQKLGEDFELTMTPVKDIPRTKSGKYRFLEQKMEIRYGESR